MPYKVELDTKPLDKTLDKLTKSRVTKATKKALRKVVQVFKEDLRPHVPQDTRQLINSWRIQSDGDLSVEAGLDIIYAMYQEMGMREDGTHVIVNRPAGGKTHFMKETVEEGAKKYLEMYLDLVMDELF